MKITYVTKSHTIGNDDTEDKYVVAQSDFDAAYKKCDERLNDLDTRVCNHRNSINNHDESIKGLTKTVESGQQWIQGIENRINCMPQTLRETLGQVVKEIFDDKLNCFAKQVEVLREERSQISAQLEELRKERQETKSQLDELRSQCAEARTQLEKLTEQLSEAKKFEDRMKDDFSMQVAEFKMAVPVPKKFAKFLFVKQD